MSKTETVKIELYGGEVKLNFLPNSHRYNLLDEEGKTVRVLRGVTTILNIIDKSAPLLGWATKLMGEYILKNPNNINSLEDLIKEARFKYKKVKEDAALSGTKVHEWIEEHIKGNDPDMPEEPEVIRGVNAFLKWEMENKPEFLWTEKVVYSRKHEYVGTADFACIINGVKYLGDIKTSKAIYPEYLLQTSAYMEALEEEIDEKYDSRLILRVSKETEEEFRAKKGNEDKEFKVFEVVERSNEHKIKDFQAFLDTKGLYTWHRENKTYVK